MSKGPISQFVEKHYLHFNAAALVDAAKGYETHLLDNGKIVLGSNQENAAYPSGLCAERVAIYYAGANYPSAKMVQMFITASPQDRNLQEPIPPCGSCRQAIAEYEMKQDIPIEILFMGAEGPIYKSDSLKNILPLVFDKNHL